MAERTAAQKTGAKGQRLVASLIEDHPHWLARELGEDYGIDLEAELTEHGVRGEILKLQIKSTSGAERGEEGVRIVIDRRYVEYAESCRYPVVLVLADTATNEVWYLWLQDWIFTMHASPAGIDPAQSSWKVWVPTAKTLSSGLNNELKSVARWEGETQLVLSLRDALRCASSTYDTHAMKCLAELIDTKAPHLSVASLDAIIDDAVRLGDRLRATTEGNAISQRLLDLIRRHGGRMPRSAVEKMVLRGESYSRVGLTALGILYDEFFDQVLAMELPQELREAHPEVAFYCAFREAFPAARSDNPFTNPGKFEYAGLRCDLPDGAYDKYINRGPSALLDYLRPVAPPQGTPGSL